MPEHDIPPTRGKHAERSTGTRGGRPRPPFHLRLTKDREVTLDYRQAAVAAGAVGLGALAYTVVSTLFGRGAKKAATAPGHTGRTEAVPMAATAAAERPTEAHGTTPAAMTEVTGATGDAPAPDAMLVEVTEVDVLAVAVPAAADTSAQTPEHVPTDLLGDEPVSRDSRAIDAFRPDPTAPVPPEMRESLRPATGPATGFAGNRGDFAQGLSQADGSK